MANRFGVTLHPDTLRWAAAERVSENVIAAVLLLHEPSVEEVAPKLGASNATPAFVPVTCYRVEV
jgi:hypothetical protein